MTTVSQKVARDMSGKNYALLIGVSEYEQLASLPACAADAIDVRNALITAEYDPNKVFLLADTNEHGVLAPPRSGDILDYLENFKEMDLDSDDSILFYFSGHGIRSNEDYLLPSDVRLRHLDRTAYQVKEVVKKYLLASGSRQVVMVLDACRNELLSDPREKGGQPKVETLLQKTGIGEQTTTFLQELKGDERGVAALFSCLPGEKSFIFDDEMGPRSSFSKCLADAIRSPDHVTLKQVADYLLDEVQSLNTLHHLRPQKPYLVPVPHDLQDLGLFGTAQLPTDSAQVIARLVEFEEVLGLELVDEMLEFVGSPAWYLSGLHKAKRNRILQLTNRTVAETSPEVLSRFGTIWETLRKTESSRVLRQVEPASVENQDRES